MLMIKMIYNKKNYKFNKKNNKLNKKKIQEKIIK